MTVELFVYKSDQGRRLRVISSFAWGLLSVFAGYKLYSFLLYSLGPRTDFLWVSDWTWLTRHLFGLSLASYGFTPALVMSAVFFGYLLYMGWEFLSNHERTAEFLIETEKEMRKVSWPTWEELQSSSIVVILGVLFLGAYLFAVDVILALVIERIVGLG